MSASGFILYDKPAGPTSFSALGDLKRTLGTTKLGHTGTLDSFATGLLVVLVGAYSRITPWIVGLDKEYEATIAFGAETDTLDPIGRPIAFAPPPSREAIESALPEFIGTLLQVPPKYSALHIGGVRASDKARRGEEFDIAPRRVAIGSIQFLSYEASAGEGTPASQGALVRLRLSCSSGTYVRSFARDLALRLGSRAHLAALRRTAVGPFRVENAMDSADPDISPRALDAETALAIGLGVVRIGQSRAGDFALGKLSALSHLVPTLTPSSDTAVFVEGGPYDGAFLGIVGWKEEKPCFRLVLAPAREEGR
ncbi:MAG TPA: tRNA pseudouridine(55) synthase TruB [Rectinemataceae bacterium]